MRSMIIGINLVVAVTCYRSVEESSVVFSMAHIIRFDLLFSSITLNG